MRSFRILRKQTWYSLTVVLIVSIPLAVATVASSLINAILWKPVPGQQTHEVYRVSSGSDGGRFSPKDSREVMEAVDNYPVFSYCLQWDIEVDFQSFKSLARTCEFQNGGMETLGWTPLKGRILTKADTIPNAPPVAVISYYFWKNQLQADPSIIGKALKINGKLFEIIGVLPPQLDRIKRMYRTDLWYSYFYTSVDWKYETRNWEDQVMMIRINDADTIPEIKSKLKQISSEISERHQDTSSYLNAKLIKENEAIYSDSKSLIGKSKTIALLIIALLLITSLNLGMMILFNNYRRKQEFAIRRAIGASTSKLIQHIFGEVFLLLSLAGLITPFFCIALIHLFKWMPVRFDLNPQLDPLSIGIGFSFLVLMGLISTSIPAGHFIFGSFKKSLDEGTKTSNAPKFAKILLIAQVGISVILVASTSLFFVSLRNSLKLDLGFDSQHLSFFKVYLQTIPADKRQVVLENLQEQILHVPGIESVGIGAWGPLKGVGSTRIVTDKYNIQDHPDLTRSGYYFAMPGYFESLNIPLLKGRMFESQEVGYPYRVAIINETMASTFWKGEDAIGKTFFPWGNAGEDPTTVIGICRDYVLEPWRPIEPVFIIPELRPTNTFLIKSLNSVTTVSKEISGILQNPGNEYVAGELIPFADYHKTVFSDTQTAFLIIALLSLIALMLSTFGTYYITQNFVHSNWKEMCIRMAIGARPNKLVFMVSLRSLTIVILGLLMGFILSWICMRYLNASLQGVENSTLPILMSALPSIGIVAFCASILPSLKLLKINPAEILRQL